MRIGPPAASPWTSAWSAQLTQTLVLAAGNRSSPSNRPVEPIGAIRDQTVAPRVGARVLDIRT